MAAAAVALPDMTARQNASAASHVTAQARRPEAGLGTLDTMGKAHRVQSDTRHMNHAFRKAFLDRYGLASMTDCCR